MTKPSDWGGCVSTERPSLSDGNDGLLSAVHWYTHNCIVVLLLLLSSMRITRGFILNTKYSILNTSMSWFSKLKQILSPTGSEQLEQETGELLQAVDTDRKVVAQHMSQTNTGTAHPSTLSPFASRILEKAKIESLKDDDQRKKITSPAELFLTNSEAKKRIGHIKSIALERSKNAANTFTEAARNMIPKADFSSFMKKQKEDSSDK